MMFGNGFMRQYRSDSTSCTKVKTFSLGIPTGTIPDDKNLDSPYDNRMTYRQIIDDSIDQIIIPIPMIICNFNKKQKL